MLYFLIENVIFEGFGAPREGQNELKRWNLQGLSDVVKIIVEVHLGLDTSTFAFALDYWRFSNMLMCVSNEFDSDWVGDEDEVVGKIQNDATSAFACAVNYKRFSNILMCVRITFDSGKYFKGKIGDVDTLAFAFPLNY